MTPSGKSKRICNNGHTYFKSSDCPVCPICEKERAAKTGFLSSLPAPARHALEGAGIKTLVQLSKMTGPELLKLHGMGPDAVGKIRVALKAEGLYFKKETIDTKSEK
jgi:DNA-directed RNA polymerase alpha subunit